MLISVKAKIRIAGRLSRIVRYLYLLSGRSVVVKCKRRGANWKLDLSEGIDFAIWLFGAYEPEVVSAYSKILQNGSIAIDIGANIGAHTIYMAERVCASGHVYGIEPTDYAISKLRENLALNPSIESCVSLYQLFLVDTEDAAMPDKVCSSWPLSERRDQDISTFCGLEKSVAGASAKTLDTFCLEKGIDRIDLIKLDVDGHESDVIQGGQYAIQKFRPAIIMELAPFIPQVSGTSFEELIGCINRLNYELIDLKRKRTLPAEADRIEHLIPGGASINVLCLPR